MLYDIIYYCISLSYMILLSCMFFVYHISTPFGAIGMRDTNPKTSSKPLVCEVNAWFIEGFVEQDSLFLNTL